MKNSLIIEENNLIEDNSEEISEFFSYESENQFLPLFDKYVGYNQNTIILDHPLIEDEYNGDDIFD